MRLSTTPMNLNKRTNEKSKKTIGASVMRAYKNAHLSNRNGMYVRNRPNGSTSKKRHDVVNGRKLCVRVHRLLY